MFKVPDYGVVIGHRIIDKKGCSWVNFITLGMKDTLCVPYDYRIVWDYLPE